MNSGPKTQVPGAVSDSRRRYFARILSIVLLTALGAAVGGCKQLPFTKGKAGTQMPASSEPNPSVVQSPLLPTPEPKPVQSEVLPPMPARLSRPRIVVDKSARTLELYDNNTLYGRYPVALGFAPVGQKLQEGDGKTPEGEYYVCVKNPNSSFHLSLGVSYPNAEDAARGLASGLIDRATYDSIKAAIAAKRCPPWNTALGGEIMIHGNGSQSDWTFGCIAVENDVMDILFRVCPLGTAIKINP